MRNIKPNFTLFKRTRVINIWDIIAILIVLGILLIFGEQTNEMYQPITTITQVPISLDPSNLPEYAASTTLRMLIAVICSLIFTFIYSTLAAKTRLEVILVPLLDILQSVPILGYISFTVVAFINMFPGSALGIEAAAIFAIFTSQAWNMAFSFYQSLKTIPVELKEAANILNMSAWQKFCRLELPFAVPGLLWNTMLSMSGGWFFVVASEAVTVGDTTFLLPGIGSYIATAINQKSIISIIYAVIAMSIVIILYDQLLFKPLVIWAKKFKYENSCSKIHQGSWIINLFRKVILINKLFQPLIQLGKYFLRLSFIAASKSSENIKYQSKSPKIYDYIWYLFLVFIALACLIKASLYFYTNFEISEIFTVIKLGMFTAIRVIILIILASLVWVPLGVYIGLRPKLVSFFQPIIQFLAAFPVNLIFPLVVILISKYSLNPSIWLSPLMILGTQWYILFNVIAGTSAFPNDLKEACANYKIKGFLWWFKVMLPAISPYVVTGIMTASGGSWNASIVAEIVTWGNTTITTPGLGLFIAENTTNANFNNVVLGVAIMCCYVMLFNKIIWRPLYNMAEKNIKI